MNDTCLICDAHWEQGDFAVVIGHIDAGKGSLIFVHRDCLLTEVVGDETAQLIIARSKGD